MQRRGFLRLIGGAAVAAPFAAVPEVVNGFAQLISQNGTASILVQAGASTFTVEWRRIVGSKLIDRKLLEFHRHTSSTYTVPAKPSGEA